MSAANVQEYGDIGQEQENTVLFVCDMQEKFQKAVQHFAEITKICNRLTTASKILEIPLIVTEQYPQGLGKTVPEIDIEHAVKVVPKTEFTMMTKEVRRLIEDSFDFDVKHVIVCGVETHVCVQQTVIDLLKMGMVVHVIADGTSSRNPVDRHLALERFRQMGAFVTSSEGVLLQLVGSKDHPRFKEIQKLIMEIVPTGLHPQS